MLTVPQLAPLKNGDPYLYETLEVHKNKHGS